MARSRNQPTDKPVIIVESGNLPSCVDKGEQALIDGSHLTFQRGGRLVKIAPYKKEKNRKPLVVRESGAPVLIPYTVSSLREELCRCADWKKYDGRKDRIVPTDCPLIYSQTLLERGHWSIPELSGYIEAPTVTADGKPITQPGYDVDSGLYLIWAETFTPPTDSELSKSNAIEAVKQIGEAISTFPFVSEADRSAGIAAYVTVPLARSLPAVPMIGVSATAPGTGKTMLVDGASLLAVGRKPTLVALGDDDNEFDKRLVSALFDGDMVINIDNIERPIKSDLLCQVITQSVVSLRRLGGSALSRVPTNTCIFVTSNNLVTRGDLVRREMRINLDAKMESPETRSFSRDHLTYIRERRSELLRSAMTISMAYLHAGEPPVSGHTPIGSFEYWDKLVRRPLMWLGLPDPLSPAASLRDDDPDRQAMRALFHALNNTYPGRVTTAAEISDDASRSSPRFDGQGREPLNPDLHAAIEQLCGSKFNSRLIGYALRRYRGRRIDGLVLESTTSVGRNKVAGWQVKYCG